MKTIWKYEITPGPFSVVMPVGAQILDVQIQDGQAMMWALVKPDADKEHREFVTYGTGHSIHNPDDLAYVGTFQVVQYGLVFHLFEEV